MTSWCENNIFIEGKRDDLINLIEGMKGKPFLFSGQEEDKSIEYTFNTYSPIPEKLKDVPYYSDSAFDNFYLKDGELEDGYTTCLHYYGCNLDVLDHIKDELNSFLDIIKSNKRDWQDINFQLYTPCSPPIVWLKAMASKNPSLIFEVTSICRGMGVYEFRRYEEGEIQTFTTYGSELEAMVCGDEGLEGAAIDYIKHYSNDTKETILKVFEKVKHLFKEEEFNETMNRVFKSFNM